MKPIFKISLFLLLLLLVFLGIFYLFIEAAGVKNTNPAVIEADLAEINGPQNDILAPVQTSTPPIRLKPIINKPAPHASLVFVGDIMLSRSVEQAMVKKNDWLWPFKLFAGITSKADLAFGNLETAIIPGREILVNEFVFRTDPKAAAGLKFAGFDVLSLANNHTPNFGQDGLKRTFAELDKAGIGYVGAGSDDQRAAHPVVIEKNSIKFGFLAYAYSAGVAGSYFAGPGRAGLNPMDINALKADIEKLKPQVDFIIVSQHDGIEYKNKPTPHQAEFARTAIEAGADLVIGHHPHVVQTLEKYKDGYIFYSLGNFIFDQQWSEATQRGLALKIIFEKEKIAQIELIPLAINKSFQPQPVLVNSKTAQAVLADLAYPYVLAETYSWDGKTYKPAKVIAAKIANANQIQSGDLDGDGVNEEVKISDGTGLIYQNSKEIFRTEAGWQVENAVIGDFNNDGILEVGFSLWKQGSYGTSKPFWVKENDTEISNHLFLYQLYVKTPGSGASDMRMVWGSSALDNPIKEMALGDFDQDGKNELAVIESNCGRLVKDCDKTNLGIWRWNEFSFYNVFKGEKGNYSKLGMIGGQIFLE